MKKVIVIFSFLIVVMFIYSGCATMYQPMTWTGGYRDTQLQPDVFQIYVSGNAYISADQVFKYALVRSAELTLQNDCEYFYILNISEGEKTSYSSSAATSGYVTNIWTTPITKPKITMIIKTVKEPEEGEEDPFEAQFIIDNVKPEVVPASRDNIRPITEVAVVSGTPTELKQFPVVFNGKHIMNVYLKHTGKTPEDKNSEGAKTAPPEQRDEVDFYRCEFENLTEYKMEFFETKHVYWGQYFDEKGEQLDNQTIVIKRDELLEKWGIETMTLEPFESSKNTSLHSLK